MMALRGRKVSGSAEAARRALYDEGLSDREIGLRLGEKSDTIAKWRKSRGLASKQIIGANDGPLTKAQKCVRLLLYQLGWSDYHIAAEQKRDRVSVREWRRRAKLIPNFPIGVTERYLPRPTMEMILRRVSRAIGRGLPRDIADEATADLMINLLDGTIGLNEIEKEARRYGNKALERFANKYGPRSIDEVMQGTEDLRMIDMLPDPGSSEWLEEMGATVG
jgi:hypothetical protein